ncbi:Laminin subunit alpha-3, partial [Exaiptasia diaphana]
MVCDKKTGRCPCKVRIRGMKCDLCPLSHYDFPRCKACQCSSYGSYTYLCNDKTGQCNCKPGVYGRQCNQCPPGYYNFPLCW